MLLKFLAFFAFVIAILPNLKLEFINGVGSRVSYMWITFPILITSFSYHHIIPTLRIYTDSDKKTLHKAIFIGSVIPLFIYMLWILSTLGSIPLFGESSFHSILQSGDISSGIVSSYHSYLVGKFAYIFEAIAVTTSFLGVTLGLYHFNLDAYKLSSKKHGGRCIGFLITFIPALIYVICYPKGFIIALGYASFFCAILLIALPAAMAWSVRSKLGINNHRSKLYLSIMFGLAIFVMGLEICTLLGILPKLT
jgi:tyrosine-specific transport protein